MPLSDIQSALRTVGVPIHHYLAAKVADKYIVWAEDGEADSEWADNKKQLQVLTGTIDYFTKMEYDPNISKIQEALNDAEISWKLNSVQYEELTKYIHYEWALEVV